MGDCPAGRGGDCHAAGYECALISVYVGEWIHVVGCVVEAMAS